MWCNGRRNCNVRLGQRDYLFLRVIGRQYLCEDFVANYIYLEYNCVDGKKLCLMIRLFAISGYQRVLDCIIKTRSRRWYKTKLN